MTNAATRIAKLLSGPRRTAPLDLEALSLDATARERSAAIRTRIAALLG